MSIISPCKDCAERFTACSDRCPKDARNEFGYRAWKKQVGAQKRYLHDTKNRFGVPMTASREKAYEKYRIGKRTWGRTYE